MRTFMLGAGGHARSVADALGRTLDGVVVDRVELARRFEVGSVLTDHDLTQLDPQSTELVNGIGQTGPGGPRWDRFRHFADLGFRFVSVIHPTAYVSPHARLGDGVQVLAHAVVGPGTKVGDNVLINTGALVDHDCEIGNGVHLAPGVVVCGDVRIGDQAFVGAGSTIIPGRSIGARALVGAASLVLRDVPTDSTVVGAPAARKNADER